MRNVMMGSFDNGQYEAMRVSERVGDLRAKGYREIDVDDLELREVGGQRLLLARDDASVWVVRAGIPGLGYRADRHAFTVEGGEARMLCPAHEHGGPRSLHELEVMEREHAAQVAAAAEQAAAELEQRRRSARVMTFADCERELPRVVTSLRRAVEWCDQQGGVVEVVAGGGLVVRLPAELTVGVRMEGAAVTRLLYAAEAVVVAAVKGKNGVVSAASCPDKPVLPSGRLA